MSVESHEEILRFQVGAMPLLNHISDRLNLKNILLDHISTHANELIPAVNSLLLLIYNLALGKYPLYKLNKWVSSIDLRCLGYDDNNSFNFTDDRFGRALISRWREIKNPVTPRYFDNKPASLCPFCFHYAVLLLY